MPITKIEKLAPEDFQDYAKVENLRNVVNANADIFNDANALAVTAAGTAYSLTATAAAIDFGTTDPTITINKAGKYLVICSATVKYTAATFLSSRDLTLKLRRTNNTAADVSVLPSAGAIDVVAASINAVRLQA